MCGQTAAIGRKRQSNRNDFAQNQTQPKDSMSTAHPGFKKVAAGIAKKQGISNDRASAIIAEGARHASTAAKRANPRLKRVHGVSMNPNPSPKYH